MFETVIHRCAAFGLVGGQAAAVDGGPIAADASREGKVQPDAMQKGLGRQGIDRAPCPRLPKSAGSRRGRGKDVPQHKA